MIVNLVKIPSGTNFAEPFANLEGRRCQCPHYGYVLKGRIYTNAEAGRQTHKAGFVFHWAPGHVPGALEDSENVDFAPETEFLQLIGGECEAMGSRSKSTVRRTAKCCQEMTRESRRTSSTRKPRAIAVLCSPPRSRAEIRAGKGVCGLASQLGQVPMVVMFRQPPTLLNDDLAGSGCCRDSGGRSVLGALLRPVAAGVRVCDGGTPAPSRRDHSPNCVVV